MKDIKAVEAKLIEAIKDLEEIYKENCKDCGTLSVKVQKFKEREKETLVTIITMYDKNMEKRLIDMWRNDGKEIKNEK